MPTIERALKVAGRTLELTARGFRPEVATDLANIVKQETGVGAVGVTDTERILGWAGLGGATAMGVAAVLCGRLLP